MVELLVAISIIGILSAIILSGTAATRKSGRTAQRVSDLKRVQSALDLYYANNRSYPNTGGSTSWRSVCPGGGGLRSDEVIVDVVTGMKLVPAYLDVMPIDPQTKPGSDLSCYGYTSNGTDYAFIDYGVAELMNGSFGASYAKYPELADPARPMQSWKISSPGGVNW